MTSHLCLPLKYSIKGARISQTDELPILIQPKFNVCMFFVVPLYAKNLNFRSLGIEGTRNERWRTDITTCSSGLVLTMCLSLFLYRIGYSFSVSSLHQTTKFSSPAALYATY